MGPSSNAADPAHAPPTPPFRQILFVFGKIGLVVVRRPRGADRTDASRAGRRAALARRAPLPLRAQLLHAAAGSRGDAARDLRRAGVCTASKVGSPPGCCSSPRGRCSCWRCPCSMAPTVRRRPLPRYSSASKRRCSPSCCRRWFASPTAPSKGGSIGLWQSPPSSPSSFSICRSRWSSSPLPRPAIFCAPPSRLSPACGRRVRAGGADLAHACSLARHMARAAVRRCRHLRLRPRAGAARLLLLQARRRHLRWRLRRARLHGAGGGHRLRMAHRRRDARRPRPRRDDQRPAHPRHRVRRLHRGAARRRRRHWGARGTRHAVGDIRAVLSMDLRRRAVCRAPDARPAARLGPAHRHRRRRRRHRQPFAVVRAARPLRAR